MIISGMDDNASTTITMVFGGSLSLSRVGGLPVLSAGSLLFSAGPFLPVSFLESSLPPGSCLEPCPNDQPDRMKRTARTRQPRRECIGVPFFREEIAVCYYNPSDRDYRIDWRLLPGLPKRKDRRKGMSGKFG